MKSPTAKSVCLAAALACSAGVFAAPGVSLRISRPEKLQDDATYHYRYDVTLSAYSIPKGGSVDVKVEAFFIAPDYMTPKSKLDAVISRYDAGTYTFEAAKYAPRKFILTSPYFDKNLNRIEGANAEMKGVVLRAVSGGKVLATVSSPSNSAWTKAVAKIPLNEEGGDGDLDSVSLDSASEGTYLGGTSERVATNIFLKTEWAYKGDYGTPSAYINGEMKCPKHSATHIIAYNVSPDGVDVYGDRIGCLDFNMTIVPKGTGGECAFRCWDRKCGKFYKADYDHRAEVLGTHETIARFRVCYDTSNGSWRLMVRPKPKYRIDKSGKLVVEKDNGKGPAM